MRFNKIGIVIADGCEFEPLRKIASETGCQISALGGMDCLRLERSGIQLVAVLCGIGKVNAAAAAAFLICDGAELLISTGYSGGISGIARGMTTLVTSFAEHDFDLTPLGYEPAEKPGQVFVYNADEHVNAIIKKLFPAVFEGPAVTGDCFVCDSEKRDWIKQRFGAMSCDMESAAVASTAYKCGIGTVALRRISDDAGNDADEAYRSQTAVIETDMIDMVLAAVDALAEEER